MNHGKRPRQPAEGEEGAKQWCPIHQTNKHDVSDCREIKRLAK
jgi:hypothetical protein